MFKVPDWGDDVPNVKVNFDRKTKKNDNKKQASIPVITKTNSVQNGIKNKKKKNNAQNQSNSNAKAAISKTKNINGNAKKYVQPHQNNEVNKKTTQNKQFPDKLKPTLGGGKNENLNKKAQLINKKLDRIKKKPQVVANTTSLNDQTVPNDSNQNVPKKAKKRKKPTSQNNDDTKHSDVLSDNVIKAKKKKIDQNFEVDDQEDLLFGHNNKSKNKKTKKKNVGVETKVNTKKERLKQLLDTQMKRTPIKTSGNKLRDRMLERLKAAQFRYINEKLYTSSGSEAQQLFQNDPAAFQTYHEGYQQQVKKWPVNPLDVIVKRVQKMPKTHTIADMGCGEAALSKRIPHSIRSFDLVATAPGVEVCDIAHTPLLSSSMDAVVYCLALMGTDLTQYLVEANRVLKTGGHLLIAEVESRFDKVEDFTKDVERLGFKLKNLDKTHQVFFFMEFTKIRDAPVKKSKLPVLTLKPCLYKRR